MFQFDCHAHVFETVTAIPNARYVPGAPARLSTWLENLDRHGIRGGVLVQVSFLGTDNSQLCAALERLDPAKFAGVAVVPMDVRDEELDRLVKAGVRGLRWNLVREGIVPDVKASTTQAFLDKLRSHGLHLELHLEGPRLSNFLPGLAGHGVDLVVDHFGLPTNPKPKDDPLLKALGAMRDRSNIFFKFSAPYRTPFDLQPHAETLLALVGEDHVVWGSDWPHTQYDGIEFCNVEGSFVKSLDLPLDETAVQTLFGVW